MPVLFMFDFMFDSKRLTLRLAGRCLPEGLFDPG